VIGEFAVGLARHGTVSSIFARQAGQGNVFIQERPKKTQPFIVLHIPLQAGRDWWQDEQVQAGKI
jgi:hypothetical protein